MARKAVCDQCTETLKAYTFALGELRRVASDLYAISLSADPVAIETLQGRFGSKQQAAHEARLALVQHVQEHRGFKRRADEQGR